MGEKNLSANIEFVNKNKEKLIQEYRNKYILVFEEEIVEAFDTYEHASQEGIRLYGIDADFLVYHLLEKEPVNFIMEAVL